MRVSAATFFSSFMENGNPRIFLRRIFMFALLLFMYCVFLYLLLCSLVSSPWLEPGTTTAVPTTSRYLRVLAKKRSFVSGFDLLRGCWADILDGDATSPLSQLGRQFLPLPARCRARADRFERKSYPAQQRRASYHTRRSFARSKSAHHYSLYKRLCVRCGVIEIDANYYVRLQLQYICVPVAWLPLFAYREVSYTSDVNGHRMWHAWPILSCCT